MILERIRFMKVNRHKRFNFTPRYYDERKDRIERLKEAYSENTEKTPEEQQLQLRERIQSNWNSSKSYSNKAKAANLRLIIILAALILVAYIILGNVDMFASKVIEIK